MCRLIYRTGVFITVNSSRLYDILFIILVGIPHLELYFCVLLNLYIVRNYDYYSSYSWFFYSKQFVFVKRLFGLFGCRSFFIILYGSNTYGRRRRLKILGGGGGGGGGARFRYWGAKGGQIPSRHKTS